METKTIMAKGNLSMPKMPKNKMKDHKAQVQVQVVIQDQAPGLTPSLIMIRDRKEINPIRMKVNRKHGNNHKRTIAKDSVGTIKEWVNKKKRKFKEEMKDSIIIRSKISTQSSMPEEIKIKNKRQEINTEILAEVVEEVDVEEEEEVLVVVIEAVIEVDLMTEDLEIEIEEEVVEEEEVEEIGALMIEALMIGALKIAEEEEAVVVEEVVVEDLVVGTMDSETDIKIQVLVTKDKVKASTRVSKIKMN